MGVKAHRAKRSDNARKQPKLTIYLGAVAITTVVWRCARHDAGGTLKFARSLCESSGGCELRARRTDVVTGSAMQ